MAETTGTRVEVSCLVADILRHEPKVKPESSLTNYFPASPDDYDPRLPHQTTTTWCFERPDGSTVTMLWEELDEDGCRHWVLGPNSQQTEGD